MNVEQILGPDGLFARQVPHFEYRQTQVQLAQDLDRFLESDHRIFAAEAPTGLGKTYAMLVPALHQATLGKKILFLTKSLDLQEQLIKKDLPQVLAALGLDLKVSCLKGRSNYVCLRRCDEGQHIGFLDFGDMGTVSEAVSKWALEETVTGDLSELPHPHSHPALLNLASDWSKSLNVNCPFYSDCYYYNAVRQAQEADVLVSNYSLFFTYYSSGTPFPFEYDVLVCDEAHAIATSYRNASVVSFTWNKVFRQLERMPSELDSDLDIDIRTQMLTRLQTLQSHCGAYYEDCYTAEGVVIELYDSIITDNAEHISFLASHLEKSAAEKIALDPEGANSALINFKNDMNALAGAMALCFNTKLWPEWVFTISEEGARAMHVDCADPIADACTEWQEEREVKVVALSATLCVDQTFEFWAQETGLVPDVSYRYPSPFDLPSQMSFHVVNLGASVGDSDYDSRVARVIHRYATDQGGRTLALLSSHRLLREVEKFFQEAYDQGNALYALSVNEKSRSTALQEFRDVKGQNVVLLGLESFKEGIDLPGNQLTQVIVDRIPFDHPNNPVVLAKTEQLGREVFQKYQLPCAKMKLVQAMGRLIRTKTDRGRVVLLDKRATDPQKRSWRILDLFEGIRTTKVSVRDSASS